jgi:biotin operon repressor
MTVSDVQARSGRRIVWLPNDGPRPDRYALSEVRRRQLNRRPAVAERPTTKPGRKPGFQTPLAVLSAIGRVGETPAAIAEALGLSKATINDAAKALAERGLIVRTPVRCGKTYQHALALTPKGKALADGAGA